MSLMFQQPFVRWKEWIPLATHQQRLRNLIQIIGYNINGSQNTKGKIVSYYYTLHLSTMCAPFYTSEKISKEHPIWSEVNFHSTYGTCTGMVIRVWEHCEDLDSVITVWGVYFSGLSYISHELYPSDCSAFCANTIIFHMHGGYFTSPDYFKQDQPTVARITAITLSLIDVRKSYIIESLLRLHFIQRSIKELSEESQMLLNKILSGDYVISNKTSIRENSAFLRKLLNQSKPTKVSYQEILDVKKRIEAIKFRVQLLQEEKSRRLMKFKKSTFDRNKLIEFNQEEGCSLLTRHHILSKDMEQLKEKKKTYYDTRELLTVTYAQFTMRQRQLVAELAHIYPIHESSDGKHTICDVQLPNSEELEGSNELTLSVALGFTCHLVQMISYIINIPLRYPVVHFGSRSKIIDHITHKIPDKEREFPLFARGKDRLQFNYAVYLLNKNIAQLRWYCGLGTEDLRATLTNLNTLMRACVIQNLEGAESCRESSNNFLKTVLMKSSYKSTAQNIIFPDIKTQETTSLSYSLDKGLDKWDGSKRGEFISLHNGSEPSLSTNDDGHSSESLEHDYGQKMYLQAWHTNGTLNATTTVSDEENRPEE